VVEEMKEVGVKVLREEEWQIERDLVLKKEKVYMLLKSIVLDRRLQFVAEMIKKLNSMLRIEIKLSILFYPQTDGQIKRMN